MLKAKKAPWAESAGGMLKAQARGRALGKLIEKANPIFVQLWLDHPAIGCGYRRFLILQRGRKWAKIFDPFTLCAASIPIAELAAATPVELKARSLAARIKRLELEYQPKEGAPQPRTKAVKAALALLKGCQPRKTN